MTAPTVVSTTSSTSSFSRGFSTKSIVMNRKTETTDGSSWDGRNFDEVYKVGKELGKGAFSVVKQGTHNQTKATYAIKIVTKTSLTTEDEIALKDEIDVLNELKGHMNIVHLYDVYDEPQFYYLVTEQMRGGELFDRIVAKTHYTELEARDVCRVLIGALGHCHGKKIAHRDLKPENLLLASPDNDSEIKLADFGFAKKCPRANCLTTQCGTPNYVAPEILEGTPYDTKADMWSIGVVIFTMIGGYPPFIEDRQSQLFRRIKKGDFEFHVEYWDSVSSKAKHLIASLLTVDPKKRLSAKQALRDPWINGSDDMLRQSGHLGKNLQVLKEYNAKRKFKAAVKGVVATNMMKAFVGGVKGTSLGRKLTEEDIGDLKETFSMFDKDGGGTISVEELGDVIQQLGGTAMTVKDLTAIVNSVDQNHDGAIDFSEFLDIMKKMPDSENELKEAFKAFDTDGSGSTSKEELHRVMEKFGQKLSAQELDAVMAEVDTDGDGEISFEEFKTAMNPKKPDNALKSAMKVKTLKESILSTEHASLGRRIGRSVRHIGHGSSGPHVRERFQKAAKKASAPGQSIRNMAAGMRKSGMSFRNIVTSGEKSLRNLFKKNDDSTPDFRKNKSEILYKEPSLITFDSVLIREYKTQVDINPGVSKGAALSLCWDYEVVPPVKLDDYEAQQPPRKKLKELKLTPQERAERLKSVGVTQTQMQAAIKETNIARRKRVMTLENMSQSAMHERIENLKRGFKRKLGLRKSDKKEEEDLWKNAEAYFMQNC